MKFTQINKVKFCLYKIQSAFTAVWKWTTLVVCTSNCSSFMYPFQVEQIDLVSYNPNSPFQSYGNPQSTFFFSDEFLIIISLSRQQKQFVSQHIERDQLSLDIKIDFLLFPKWLFFHLNFGGKICEIGHCFLKIWQIYRGCHNRSVKS